MAQRGIHIEGRAVAWAAESLIEELRKQAAARWQVDIGKVRWGNGRASLMGPKGRQMDLKALAGCGGEGGFKGIGHCKDNSSDLFCFYAAVADVAVDRETGEVKIPKIHFALDVTRVINPTVDDGQIMTLNLGDYKIPNIRDVPQLTTSLVKAKEGPGPFGAKAVAECGISIIAPAIANAVYNATGVRIMDSPITPEKILNGIPELERKSPGEGLSNR